MNLEEKELYTKQTFFLDIENPSIQNFLNELNLENLSEFEKILKVYYAVRDKIIYDPYHIVLKPEALKASEVINRGYGYCVEKALTLGACLRKINVPTRLGFANVKNHINSKRLSDLMKSDIFVYHGYTEIYINEKWVKATPAFNIRLCEKAGIKPLDFNGIDDSIFHPITNSGDKHMEYLHDYGTFPDMPYEKMIDEYDSYYPHLRVKETGSFGELRKAKFENEVNTN